MEELQDFLFGIYTMLKLNHSNIWWNECEDSVYINYRKFPILSIENPKSGGELCVRVNSIPYYFFNDDVEFVKNKVLDKVEKVEEILLDLERRYTL